MSATQILNGNDPRDRATAARMLAAGELVALPTETVYGLGAHAGLTEAVASIFAVKDRPRDNPLIVHLAEAAEITDWIASPPSWLASVTDVLWPGPLTVVGRACDGVGEAVRAGRETVAVRVPANRVMHDIIRRVGHGIAAPSANLSGRISPTSVEAVISELGGRIPAVVDGGRCDVGIESTIVDATGPDPRILRPGSLDAAVMRIAEHAAGVAGEGRGAVIQELPAHPGSAESHYAPRARVTLVDADDLARHEAEPGDVLIATEPTANGWQGGRGTFAITIGHGADAWMHDIYAALREADERPDTRRILVEDPATSGAGGAVADRLRRAAAGR